MKVTPILAENYSEFRKFIRTNNLNVGHFAYVTNYENIRGQRGLIMAVGRWWRNKNYTSDFHEYLLQLARMGVVSVVKGIGMEI